MKGKGESLLSGGDHDHDSYHDHDHDYYHDSDYTPLGGGGVSFRPGLLGEIERMVGGGEDDEWEAFEVVNESGMRGPSADYLSLEAGNGSFEVDRYGYTSESMRDPVATVGLYTPSRKSASQGFRTPSGNGAAKFDDERGGRRRDEGGNRRHGHKQEEVGAQVSEEEEEEEDTEEEDRRGAEGEKEEQEEGEREQGSAYADELDLVRQASNDHRGRVDSAESSYRIEQAISKAVLAKEGTPGSSTGSSLGAMRGFGTPRGASKRAAAINYASSFSSMISSNSQEE